MVSMKSLLYYLRDKQARENKFLQLFGRHLCSHIDIVVAKLGQVGIILQTV